MKWLLLVLSLIVAGVWFWSIPDGQWATGSPEMVDLGTWQVP